MKNLFYDFFYGTIIISSGFHSILLVLYNKQTVLFLMYYLSYSTSRNVNITQFCSKIGHKIFFTFRIFATKFHFSIF